MDETEYWQKSGTGNDRPDRHEFSARGWARAVHDYLAASYLPFVLRQAGRFLPASLANQARNLERRLDRIDKDGRFLGFAIDLWQSTLHLNYAVAHGLARNQHGAADIAPPSTSLEELERGLANLWPNLAGSGWFGFWGAYVGKGNAKSGVGAGKRFLVEASRPLRLLRNKYAHEFSHEIWTDCCDALRIPLLYLLDAVALWADHPLVTGLRLVPGGTNRWQGEALQGGGAWPVREFVAEGVPTPQPEGVYIRWPDPDGKSVLVPLWPFVVLEPDPLISCRVLWVLSHRDQGGGWWRRSLHNGQVQRWPERDRKGAQALNDHFRGGRRPSR